MQWISVMQKQGQEGNVSLNLCQMEDVGCMEERVLGQ